MLTFKSFISKKRGQISLVETTLPDHLRDIPDNWDHHSEVSDETTEKMNASMGGVGKDFVTFPLSSEHHHEIDADVAEHLTNHGYNVKDYKKGIASKKINVNHPTKGPMEKYVDEKIGSVLEKTGASDDVKKAYMNDPARSASKGLSSSGLHVCITHGVRGVAAMTSGTAWNDQSCMNLETGSYRHKVEEDSRHGTHIAYLIHSHDANGMKYGEPDNPIARIALKPFHETRGDVNSDTIFRPENKTYGTKNDQFTRAASQWATEKYPAKLGTTYTKNSRVYDDTGNRTYKSVSKEEVENSIKSNAPIVEDRGMLLDHDVINHALEFGKKHIESLPDDFNNDTGASDEKSRTARRFVSNMAEVGNLDTQHVAKLLKLSNGDSRANVHLASQHGDKFSTNAINDYTQDYAPSRMMLMNPKLPSRIVDSVDPDDYQYVRHSLIKPHHIDKVVDNYLNSKSGGATPFFRHSDRFTKENVDNIVNNIHVSRIAGVAPVLVKSPHFTQEHHDTLIRKMVGSPDTARYSNTLMATSKFATVKDADALDRGYSDIAANLNIGQEEHKKLKDKFMSNVLTGDSSPHTITGFNTFIPNTISKHFTPADYENLAKSGKAVSFETESHSDKHLDAIKNVVTNTDKELTAHKNRESDKDDDYDEQDDPHAHLLQNTLHKHLASYARNIDNHIDQHASENHSDFGEVIKSYDAYDAVKRHMNHVHFKLDNYDSPYNKTGERDQEHYNNHFDDIATRMSYIDDNTAKREHHDEW